MNYKTPIKKYFLKICIAIVLGLSLTSCKDPEALEINFIDIETEQNLNIDELASLRLQGFNRLQANDYLVNPKDSLSLDLVFNFLDEDSHLTVVGFTDSITTKTGTTILFSMNGRNLKVDIFFQDYPRFHLCSLENFITTNNDLRLKVQFLNTTNLGPIISIWNQSSQFIEGRKRNLNAFNINTAECSTLDTMAPINTFGAGIMWGFETFKTKLKKVKRTEAYVL